MLDLKATFEKFEDEYCKFELVKHPKHVRPDLCAFLMLHEISSDPGYKQDIISAAEHDEIYLSIDPDQLAKLITEEQVRDLVRCGVMFDGDGLCMFV